jgi:hypothetical protein
MKNHIMVNDKCLNTNKRWCELPRKQQEEISDWMYESFCSRHDKTLSSKEIRNLILDDTLTKISAADINIPEYVIRDVIEAKYNHLLIWYVPEIHRK